VSHSFAISIEKGGRLAALFISRHSTRTALFLLLFLGVH
jgi:hypothetical protein